MRIILLISCIACYSAIAQPIHHKQVKKIYALVLKYYLSDRHGNILVSDSTSNTAIRTDSFAGIINERSVLIGNTGPDPDWIKDLIEADRQKTLLRTEGFPFITMGRLKLSLINVKNLEATVSAQLQKGIIEIMPDYLQFSTIIFTRNRAIVGLCKITPDLRGDRRLFFLERRKRKWVIVSYLLRSIS